MLEALGLDESTEAVYRALLRDPRARPEQMATKLGLTQDQLDAAVARLVELELLRPSSERPGEFRPVSPGAGLSTLLAKEEAALAQRQLEVAHSRSAVDKMLADYRSLRAGHQHSQVERLVGRDAVRERLKELANSNPKEMCELVTPWAAATLHTADEEEMNQITLERGMVMRSVYTNEPQADPATAAYLLRLAEMGARNRASSILPIRLMICDRSTALVPLDPEHLPAGALAVHEPPVVAALYALFDRYWNEARPFGSELEHDQAGLLPHERELLRILAAGHTDEVAARRLGVSVRTVRRTMAALCERLDAQSRFQAGVLAARQGWI